jgi:hypothetical protein
LPLLSIKFDRVGQIAGAVYVVYVKNGVKLVDYCNTLTFGLLLAIFHLENGLGSG